MKWSWPNLREQLSRHFLEVIRKRRKPNNSYPIRDSDSGRTKYEPGMATHSTGMLSRIWTIFWNTLLHFYCLCRKMPLTQLLSSVPFCGVRTAAAGSLEPLCASFPLCEMSTCHSSPDEVYCPHLSTFSRVWASFVRRACVSILQSVGSISILHGCEIEGSHSGSDANWSLLRYGPCRLLKLPTFRARGADWRQVQVGLLSSV
jgi:hypothetical protein